MGNQWIRKESDMRLKEEHENGVTWLAFPALEKTGLVKHGFSTRLGGVSQGGYSTMNFSFSRGDDPAHVLENYSRMAKALDVERDRMVVSYQTHTTNVRTVTEADCGKGVIRERDYRDVDGLITNIPGITLVTFYADCVPLYLVDPVNHAIGLSHSGWRGTVHRMGQVTIERMKEEFGTKPEDLVVCIGPSICQDCYEVGEEVAEAFLAAFDRTYQAKILRPGKPGKYQLDLWAANEIVFQESGVRPDRIFITDICTHCNPELLFSHRRTGEKRGNLAAFLCLK